MPSSDPLSGLPGYALRRAANAMMAELGERLAGDHLLPALDALWRSQSAQ